MIILEKIGIILMLVIAGVMIWQAGVSANSFRFLNDTAVKVKVSKKNQGIRCFWIGFSVLNVIILIMNIDAAVENADIHHAKAYLYLCAAWFALLITWTFLLIFDRYAYVTSEGIITIGNPLGTLTPDKLTYRISDDELEIYVKKRKKAIKYKLTGSKNELSDLMTGSYSKFHETEKADS